MRSICKVLRRELERRVDQRRLGREGEKIIFHFTSLKLATLTCSSFSSIHGDVALNSFGSGHWVVVVLAQVISNFVSMFLGSLQDYPSI